MRTTKRIKPTKGIKQDIAINSPIIVENLPFKYVHYPNHYGTFFCFSETFDSIPFFCECNKAAIDNHFKLRFLESSNNWSNYNIKTQLSNHFFSNKISELSLRYPIEKILVFKEKLCHRCNFATPSLRYCHEMYGGNFKQYYGWYINQVSFRLGVREVEYIENYSPDEFINICKSLKEIQTKRNLILEKLTIPTISTNQILKDLEKEISLIRKNYNNKIENLTREEFGFRKIGEGNVSESILTKIIEKIYSNFDILKHHRPKWLEGLELDIYIPQIKLGIEYQGQQHFHPIKAWGGINELVKLQERDCKKRNLCKENGIKLIEIDYTEPLLEEYIIKKINP